MREQETSLGDLISSVYDEFLALYGDEELAAVATAQVINELLASEEPVVYHYGSQQDFTS